MSTRISGVSQTEGKVALGVVTGWTRGDTWRSVEMNPDAAEKLGMALIVSAAKARKQTAKAKASG
jgi:hypothetical protein